MEGSLCSSTDACPASTPACGSLGLHPARPRVRPRPALLGHRRLRLPRQPAAAAPGRLRLRRLLHRHGLGRRSATGRGFKVCTLAGPRRPARLLRRGRSRRALPRHLDRPALLASTAGRSAVRSTRWGSTTPPTSTFQLKKANTDAGGGDGRPLRPPPHRVDPPGRGLERRRQDHAGLLRPGDLDLPAQELAPGRRLGCRSSRSIPLRPTSCPSSATGTAMARTRWASTTRRPGPSASRTRSPARASTSPSARLAGSGLAPLRRRLGRRRQRLRRPFRSGELGLSLWRQRPRRRGGPATSQFQFGPPGRDALPVAGDWNGDGRDGLGVYDPASAVFRLQQFAQPRGQPDALFRSVRGGAAGSRSPAPGDVESQLPEETR